MSFGRRNKGSAKGFGATTGSAEIVELPTRRTLAASRDNDMEMVLLACQKKLREDCQLGDCTTMSRLQLADVIRDLVDEICDQQELSLDANDRRDVVTAVLNEFLVEVKRVNPDRAIKADAAPALTPIKNLSSASQSSVEDAKNKVQPILMEKMDVSKAIALPRAELSDQISAIVGEILAEQKMRLNLLEQRDLVTTLINDMLGLGPLESLLADESITDILVNGAKQVYVAIAAR